LFQLKAKTLNYWYQEQISDFREDIANKKFAGQQAHEIIEETGELLNSHTVHILKPENVGHKMCIDEKMIGKRYCTILSNSETGKMALLVESMKPEVIKRSLLQLGLDAIGRTTQICSDMSPMFKKMCREVFSEATLSVDKFHVMKQVLDVLQGLRIAAKKQIVSEDSNEIIGEYGWSKIVLLEKSRYMLYKKRNDFSDDERLVSKELFLHFPVIEQAFNLVEAFRNWYSIENKSQPRWLLERTLGGWLEQLEDSKINSFNVIRKMVEKHQEEIINYFEAGHSNSKAENLNGKIQRFVMGNYGIRNRDFFYYRLQVYFA
jgi:transposase